jgi:hypothetical protein
VSEKPYIGDVLYRSFVITRAMVAAPEEIASMCRPLMRMSQIERDRMVKRLEREEQARLYGRRTSAKRKRAA